MTRRPARGLALPAEGGPSVGAPVEVGAAAAGGVAVRVRDEAGDWATLHDTADPLASAHAQLAGFGSAPEVLVIVGAGLGYLTEAAHSRWTSATVVVVEPDAALAAAAQARVPGVYRSPRVQVVTGPAYQGAADLWRVFDNRRYLLEAPPIVADPALARAWPSVMREAACVVGRALAAARMNAQARADNAGRYVTNTLRNLRHIVAGPDPERLRHRFAGIPAVVVGAGPSLDACLPTLRAIAERALIIATDTAWRPLVGAGITPQLVVALDPTPDNGRHLVDVPGSSETWIVAEGSVDPAALATLDGRVATFRVAAHHPWPWLSAALDRLCLRAWGSVLTSAFDLAVVCDCDPVVFVGADLAFTGGQPYCRGTTMEELWSRHTARGVSLRQVWDNTIAARAVVSQRDVHGTPVATAPHLVEFRDWLAARATELAPRRIVNASGAGILHGPGIYQANLTSALADYPARAALLHETVRSALDTPAEREVAHTVAAALEVALAGDSQAAPVGDWTAFGQPTLTEAQVRAAITDGLAALTAPPSVPAARHATPMLRWHLADRVAAARARLTGDTAPLDGVVPPVARAPHEAQRDARIAIDTLLEMPALVAGPGDDLAAGAAPAVVPLSARFHWVRAARPWIALLEEAQLEGAWPAAAGVPATGEDYWNEPVVPVRPPESPAAEPYDALDHIARATLVDQLAVTASDAAGLRDLRLLAAARRALATPALAVPAAHGVTLALAKRSLRLPVVVDALMRATTGALVAADGRPDPRTAFLDSAGAFVEPDVLTSRGLPHGWSLATGGPDHAIYVPGGACHSLRLDAEGSPTPSTIWPGPITGEVPWGGAGGRLAWHASTRAVHWRVRADAVAHTTEAPFRPTHLALAPEGTPFWTDASRQLWQWTPGRAARRVAVLPMAGIPRFEGAELVVEPMPRDEDGRVVRTRLSYAWRVDGVSGDWTTVDTGPEGQAGKVATCGAWTATTHPCADLVRLSAPGVAPLWLACHSPLGVAWAGASLIVISGGSTPICFPRLLDRLVAHAAGPHLAP